MANTVYIIGTTHEYQKKQRSPAEQKCFADMLESKAIEFSINSIAEECNKGALAEHKLKTSSVEDLASKFGLPHRYCDPDWETRKELGILQRNQIEMFAHLNDDEEISGTELDEREREHFVKRERYWAKKLLDFDVWPVLFVCGADHTESFQSVLAEHELTGQILEFDWCA